MWWYELDWSNSGQGPVACSCEHCNEPSCYVRSWVILQQLSKWCSLKDSNVPITCTITDSQNSTSENAFLLTSFSAFTVVGLLKISIFWDIMLCSRRKSTYKSREPVSSHWLSLKNRVNQPDDKRRVTTLVDFHWTMQFYIPEDSTLQSLPWEPQINRGLT
jgi:hypothetical protein